VIGFIFGRGADGPTCACDANGDGVTNPAPINGNTGVSLSADDDGGFFRQKAAAYYQAGAMPLAGGGGATTPTPTAAPATPTPIPTATPTLIPTATPTPTVSSSACTPRPPVTIQTARTAVGQLSVVVTAATPPATPSNGLRRIRFERLKNALVTVRTFTDQQDPFVVELPDHPRQVAFSVTWKKPAAFTVNFTVEDDCAPPWRTFVGASPQAF
jgi:hypothetical protein